jgi:adenylate cyclase
VTALSADDLAMHAGVALDTIQTFVDAGMLAPDDSGAFREPDVARVRLVDSLVEAGLGLAELSRAVNDGRLSLSYVDLLMPEPVRLVPAPDRGEEKAGRLEYEQAIGPILGSQRAPDAPIREDDFAILGLVTEAIELGAPPERVFRIIRSIAQAAVKLTHLQRDWVDEVLLTPAIERTGSPISALKETSATRLRYREIGKEVTGLLMDRFVDDAIFGNLVELTERALSDVGIHPTGDQQTIVFIDISGYTRLAEERGDNESASQAARLMELAANVARDHGGRLVKSLGDGAMVHASNQRAGVSIALEAVSRAESAGLWPLHAGVNSGPMVRRDGDFFGAAVNIASRVADVASPGEVVVTENIVTAAEGTNNTFIPLGESQLKNVGTPLSLYRVQRASQADE